MTYKKLAMKLNEIGLEETLKTVNNKIHREHLVFHLHYNVSCDIIRLDDF